MAYVIVDTCTKDQLCIDACPVDCIHPKEGAPDFETVPQLYIDPATCIDCGACIPVCPTNSIFVLEDLPEDQTHFAEINAKYFA